MSDHPLQSVLTRIADALERLTIIPSSISNLHMSDAFIWDGEAQQLESVNLCAVPLQLLHGIDHVRDILLANTRQFAQGLPANNALLWGARGMGKSSLVKAIFQELKTEGCGALAIIELHHDELHTLPVLLQALQESERQFILFCDDLSFDKDDASYKSLKSVLDGSIAGKPDNVVFYATSNRRHLMPRDMMENERATAIHAGEGVEEKVSLSDRFGLWLGFYGCDQQEYLAMVDSYAAHFAITTGKNDLHRAALEWATTRGGRSGRVAWQFITDCAGKEKIALKFG
jgi:uncharacterized protein